MQKNLLYVLIVLMSLSLVGIIAVQIFWIKNSLNDKEEQFSFAIKQTLATVSTQVENREYERYYRAFSFLKDSLGVEPQERNIREALLIERNDNLDETITYSTSLLTENYKLDPQLLEIDLDSVTFTKLINKKSRTSSRKSLLDRENSSSDISYEKINQLDMLAFKIMAQGWVQEVSQVQPLSQRISKDALKELLNKELAQRRILSDFEFAIYQGDYATRVQSLDFDFDTDATWSYPLFNNEDSQAAPYTLYLNLPGRKKFILSSITGMALLSLLFTSVIVIAYSGAITQIFKQRQISQIKSDFINNMTHEFKTPIATINLALDSLKHPKISSDSEKVANYHRMIREENKRMHSQVQNVLRISQLEKNDLELKKETIDCNEIINSSISHIKLLLEERNGVVHSHLGALRTQVFIAESHMTNVFINVLENAIKYTDDREAPVIDIFTENVKNKLVVKIRDQGIGMSKSSQRKVFEKFFREHTGDIHNVKGHGLGLAYAQRILEDHEGQIFVESIKGQGSTFIIHLPLIT